SAMRPKMTPPMAQPTSRTDVRTPVQNSVADRAAGEPIGRPSSVGTQLGATKLKRSPSKMAKPHPSQAAKITVHWYPVRPSGGQGRGRGGVSVPEIYET